MHKDVIIGWACISIDASVALDVTSLPNVSISDMDNLCRARLRVRVRVRVRVRAKDKVGVKGRVGNHVMVWLR